VIREATVGVVPIATRHRRCSRHCRGAPESSHRHSYSLPPNGVLPVSVSKNNRSQPRSGRLDMLLYDAETSTRYEVELQFGATDESHIIRTIEYWDIEWKRYPQYHHVGVIAAEEITARFFNVISLFNTAIPLIAIQVSAIQVANVVTLMFTKVLDQMPLGLDETDVPEERRDRTYWEAGSNTAALELTGASDMSRGRGPKRRRTPE
jgi:hypothetical protein